MKCVGMYFVFVLIGQFNVSLNKLHFLFSLMLLSCPGEKVDRPVPPAFYLSLRSFTLNV